LDDAVARSLAGLCREHGDTLLDDPARLEAFLRDVCPGSRAEIHCLVLAVREGAVPDLREVMPDLPAEAAAERLAARLRSDLRYDDEAASWTAGALAGALVAGVQKRAADQIGYCLSCHETVPVAPDGAVCSVCGEALIDVRESRREPEGEPVVSQLTDSESVPDSSSEAELVAEAAEVAERSTAEMTLPAPETWTAPEMPSSSSEAADGLAAEKGPIADSALLFGTGSGPGEDGGPGLGRWQDAESATGELQEEAAESALSSRGLADSSEKPMGPQANALGVLKKRRILAAIAALGVLAAVLVGVFLSRGGATVEVVGSSGRILATSDGGASWTTQTSGTGAWLLGVAFADVDHGWAVGVSGTIVATSDGGATWRMQSSGLPEWLRGVAFADREHGWAVGDGGTILATSDGGASWTPQSSGVGFDLRGASVQR
jgi:hypothetical protein